ncbi:MAG: hypothetical protein GXP42_01620 [Chloroflexi bacterium]|nr:hypothetical protein [Chloroflexota bacterium]
MKEIFWLRALLGAAASIGFAILGSGLIIALVIRFSPADSLQEVQSLSRFAVVVGVMFGVGSAWGSFVALRGLPANHVKHGALIGALVGAFHFFVASSPFVLDGLVFIMTVAAGILGARIVELNPPKPRS